MNRTKEEIGKKKKKSGLYFSAFHDHVFSRRNDDIATILLTTPSITFISRYVLVRQLMSTVQLAYPLTYIALNAD